MAGAPREPARARVATATIDAGVDAVGGGATRVALHVAIAVACGLPARAGLAAGAAGAIAGAAVGTRGRTSLGAEAALVAVVVDVARTHGAGALPWFVLLVGLAQIVLGVARVGELARHAPAALVRGIAVGAGALLLARSIPVAFGLETLADVAAAIARGPAGIAPTGPALVVAAVTATSTVLLPRVHRALPGAAIGLALASALAASGRFDVARAASIPLALPSFGPGGVDVAALAPRALALAFVGALAPLLGGADRAPAQAADRALVAQGLASCGSALFSGLPVVASLAGGAAGARVRFARGAEAALFVAVAAAAGPALAQVPLAAFAGVLVVEGVRLVDVARLRALVAVAPGHAWTAFGTAVAFAILGVAEGVLAGLLLAATEVVARQRKLRISVARGAPLGAPAPPGDGLVVRISGPLFFASHHDLAALARAPSLPAYLVLDLSGVPLVDVTALRTLEAVLVELRARACAVALAGATFEVERALAAGGVVRCATVPHVAPDVEAARHLLAAALTRGGPADA